MARARVSGLALGTTLVVLLAACSGGQGSGSDSGGPQGGGQGGSYSIAGTEPEAFAPTSNCYSADCSQIINQVWTGLLRIDENQKPVLLAAESIDSPDSRVWTIKLKDGFTFHNGERVTADAYVRAWNYAAYGPNATRTASFFSKIDGYDAMQGDKPKAKTLSGLEAVDANTIKVTLTKPFSQWPLVMSYVPAFAPMAEACLNDIKGCNEKPIGDGPYEFAEKWSHNQQIVLKKNPDYTDDPTAGNADEITIKFYSDLKTAYRDFQSGNVDIIPEVDPTQRKQAESQYPDQILRAESGSYSYFGFPFYDKAFQDVRIREALSLAVDRQAIIDNVLNGDYEPAGDVLPGFVPGGRDDACEFCKYDPDRAKQLYEEAGGIPGDKVDIWFNNDGGHEEWVQALAQGWKQVLGLDFDFKSQPFTPYLNTLGTRSKVDGPYRLGWLPDYPSPENYLDPIYGAGSSNYGDWGKAGTGTEAQQQKFIDLVAKGDAEGTIDKAVKDYQAAADVVLDNMVVIPLWFGKTFTLSSTRVSNVEYTATEQVLLGKVTVTG